MHPFGLPSQKNTGGLFLRGDGVIHCLLVDTGDGLALVDTGWGLADCISPPARVKLFANLVGCPLDVNETAIRQTERLGYNPAEVTHIFLTHMHLDHAGGLPDFPNATVHIHVDELDACLHSKTYMERWTYIPEHYAHQPKWQTHQTQGHQWFGLDCAPPIQVGKTEFIMLPFPGHTRGHCAVAIRVDKKWLLHCGDMYGYYRQIDSNQPYAYPGGKFLEFLITTGFKMPRHHWDRIRKLLEAHGDKIQAFCSHDAHEIKTLI
jgi:glyoxylase-like metal-dependent hydrolase (beta-lactamase superfamily II)